MAGDMIAISEPDSVMDEGNVSLDAARGYIGRGWNPTPVLPGEKAARLRDWETTRIDEANVRELFRPGDEVGLVLGELSGGLTLVDLDGETARRLADRLLPETELIDGRPGSPEGHRFYRCEPVPRTRRYTGAKTGETLVELHGNGRQVVVPPSRHPSGEVRAWSRCGEPAPVGGEELGAAVTRLAVWCELTAIWPEAGRHEAGLALTGGLLRAGWDEEPVLELLQYLCRDTVSNRNELPHIVEDTARKLETEEHVTGWPTLAKATGEARSVEAILGWLGVTGVDLEDDRPAVRVYGGDLDKLSDQSWAALAITNDPPLLFRRSNQPVRVERIDDSELVIIQALDDVKLRYHLSAAIRYWQWGTDKATKQTIEVPSKVSTEVVKNMLAYEETPLPVLARLVTVPVFAPDGTLQTEPGYHAAARVYYAPPPGLVIPAVPEKPTAADVATAKRWLLDELLGEFPFVADADRAHAVALALLPFVRDLIDGPTPLHLFEAGKQGTGKGLLAAVLTGIATGGDGASTTPLAKSEDEVRKLLFSKLLEGDTFILLDNLSGTVSSDALSIALTSSTYSDRVLGVSATAHVPVRCGWVATANNAALSSDLTRRTIRSRVVADVENPHLRTFAKEDLPGWAKENRAELIWSALTLVQAWVAAGQPAGKAVPLGSYVGWSRVVGGVLGVAGIPGFLGNLQEFYADVNTESVSWQEFVAAWWTRYGPEPQSATALLPVADAVGFTFEQGLGDKRKAELGTKLRGQKDNIYAGFAIRQGKDRRSKANSYRLEPREGQTWEPPKQTGETSNGAAPLGDGPFGLLTVPPVGAAPTPGRR